MNKYKLQNNHDDKVYRMLLVLAIISICFIFIYIFTPEYINKNRIIDKEKTPSSELTKKESIIQEYESDNEETEEEYLVNGSVGNYSNVDGVSYDVLSDDLYIGVITGTEKNEKGYLLSVDIYKYYDLSIEEGEKLINGQIVKTMYGYMKLDEDYGCELSTEKEGVYEWLGFLSENNDKYVLRDYSDAFINYKSSEEFLFLPNEADLITLYEIGIGWDYVHGEYKYNGMQLEKYIDTMGGQLYSKWEIIIDNSVIKSMSEIYTP